MNRWLRPSGHSRVCSAFKRCHYSIPLVIPEWNFVCAAACWNLSLFLCYSSLTVLLVNSATCQSSGCLQVTRLRYISQPLLTLLATKFGIVRSYAQPRHSPALVLRHLLSQDRRHPTAHVPVFDENLIKAGIHKLTHPIHDIAVDETFCYECIRTPLFSFLHRHTFYSI